MARKRRGRAEGSIFQRESDARWVGSVSLGYGADGKRLRRTVYGDTKSEAQEKLDALKTEARAGNLPDAGTMTVGQLFDQWLAVRETKDAPRTFEERKRTINNHLRPRIGGVRLTKVNALHVEGLYTELHRAGVGPGAIENAGKMLKGALTHAVRKKLIMANPAMAVDSPKAPEREMLCLDDLQVRAVLAAGRGLPTFSLIATSLGTGCRQGELLALTWDDVDLRKGTLTVRKSLSPTEGGYVVKEPKTKSGRRTIALPPFVVEALTAHKAAMLKTGLLDAPVFCTRTGTYQDKANVLKKFRAVVARANKANAEVEGYRSVPATIRFHDMRHTAASLLLSKGYSLVAVSRRLGHAKPSITLDVYGHLMPTDDAQLAEGLHRMMG
jgi:integrase